MTWNKFLFAMILFCGLITRTQAQSVTQIQLGSNQTIQLGYMTDLQAMVLPADAADKSLQWESSNVGVAKIVFSNNNGARVRGDGSGTAWITARAKDGSGVVASVQITVVSLIRNITLALPGSFLNIGVTTRPQVILEPADPTNAALDWQTNNSGIISVAPDGTITTHSAGTTTITASAQDGSGTSGSLTITVHRPVTDLTIDGGDFTLKVGEGRRLSASIEPADATTQGIRWKSNNSAVARITSSGYLTAMSTGTATITVQSDDHHAAYPQHSITVTVEEVVLPPAPQPQPEPQPQPNPQPQPQPEQPQPQPQPEQPQPQPQPEQPQPQPQPEQPQPQPQPEQPQPQPKPQPEATPTPTPKPTPTPDQPSANLAQPQSLMVWTADKRLYVDSPAAEIVEVYNLTGQRLSRFTKPAGRVVYDLSSAQPGIIIARGSSGWVRKLIL